MKTKIYTIFDSKAEAFNAPFYFQHDAQAIRGFADAVNSPESHIGMHPEDYTLFVIGTYDDETAEIKTESPAALGVGVIFLNKTNSAQKGENE